MQHLDFLEWTTVPCVPIIRIATREIQLKQTVQLKQTFGAFDLLGAACLWRRQTRKIGLLIAVIGFSGGLYGQVYTGEDVTQVAVLLGVTIVGLLFSP